MSNDLPLRCLCRKHAVTHLRCSRCSAPICPDCSIVAPVGMICRTCMRGARSPLMQVGPALMARGAAITLPLSIFGGWVLADISLPGLFGLWFPFLYGLGVGEIALRATGRRRGPSVEILAGISALVGVVCGLAIHMRFNDGDALAELLRQPLTYVGLVIAAASAVGRTRSV